MLVEHALLASGDVAEAGAVYSGWPARQLEKRRPRVTQKSNSETSSNEKGQGSKV